MKALWPKQARGELGQYLATCGKCGRKILVELVFFGVPHNGEPHVTCAVCIQISAKFAEHFPDEARDITEWVKESTIINLPLETTSKTFTVKGETPSTVAVPTPKADAAASTKGTP